MDKQTQTELEAATFRRLLKHLDERKDVQNIDLMILAGFCRNCLGKWYKAAADERDIELDAEQARDIVYGMPYAEWKANHQQEATPEQLAAFAKLQNK
ncbi:DUF1244 domain-containing protein [Pseudoteredinibacter isoporae]|uniref:SMc04008-like domain-containing protein n=1 Tax=Pseudoteredinibacter isoporae TaxID=570281 RepID=A0A7X0JVA4_9GAMM|nr:DUF1244 domain-containing protein [Pseudoteredinibacter isoporae]MBB6522920.1 hypothetical protein [Pseudoteredinibacter isoporae]NHO88446.1 DUF1244 domain-containing protein [Pseudoteredinibacter isoporae]NIB23223.1 DUF1244 domain-containing protein [Pseudoteredinibacter isoporae]